MDGRGRVSGGETGGRAGATREALLRAGTELFALQGYDGVSVETLARHAGVNKALINYHFGGKRQLYLAILRWTFGEVRERLQALLDSGLGPREQLREFMAIFHELATTRRPHFPALLLREVLAAGRTFDEEVVPQLLALFGGVRQILEGGVRQGVFRPINPLLAHMGIIGSLTFYYATEPTRRRLIRAHRLPGPEPRPREYLEHMQTTMLRGLAASRRPRNTSRKREEK